MNLSSMVSREWDAIVVGAGPAGAVAARQLALAGARVLLVDKAPFGRAKVCGCCLNGAAIKTLSSIRLDGVLDQLGAVSLETIRLAAGRCQASLGIAGMSLSREAFDAALVGEAMSAGATFLPETRASLGPASEHGRQVLLCHDNVSACTEARLVLAADGLGGSFNVHRGQLRPCVQPGSRIGAGTSCDAPSDFFEPGTIYMACAKSGYVGLVRLEDGRLNIATALDPAQVRRSGGPGPLAAQILTEVGWPVKSEIAEATWRGTPALTRRAQQLYDERMLVLGDAAGYVEPFTGEGMAWALASAVAITPLALAAIKCWSPEIGLAWEQRYHRTITRRQATCRHAAWALRHPVLIRMAIKLLGFHPQFANPVIKQLSMR